MPVVSSNTVFPAEAKIHICDCRELSRKAERANNLFWWASGLLGDSNRVVMYAILQGLFTIATIALTLPMFVNYRFHVAFQIFKIVTSVWNGECEGLEILRVEVSMLLGLKVLG